VKIARTYWPWLPVAAAGFVLLGREWRSSLGARTWISYAAIVFLVISLAAGRRGRYLFQLYPAFAVAAGVALAAAAERAPRLLPWLVVPAAMAAIAVVYVGERASKTQAGHSREALELAQKLGDADDVVLITRATQWGEPQFGKILGFYGRPLLFACRAACEAEAAPGRRIVVRTRELDHVLDHLVATGLVDAGGAPATVAARTQSLALLRVPPLPLPHNVEASASE
jgi:hypothetical protein